MERSTPPKHYIIVGRISRNIAAALVHRFGRENIIQSRYGTHSDGEATFELFLDGKLEDHPLEQNFTDEQKQDIREGLKGSHITIVHSISGEKTSSRAMSLFQSLNYFKRDAAVKSITLITPHMALTRADRRFLKKLQKEGGVEITVRQDNALANAMMAKMARMEGADRIVGIDFHSNDAKNQYREVFETNYDLVAAIDLLHRGLEAAGTLDKSAVSRLKRLQSSFGDAIKNPYFPDDGATFISAVSHVLVPQLKSTFNSQADLFNIMLGAPDGANKLEDSGVARAREANEGLFGYYDEQRMFYIAKDRIGPSETAVIPKDSRAPVAGKVCVLVDDIVSSGSTQIKAAKFLKEQGASKVIAYATHGVLVGDNLNKLIGEDSIDELWVSDTVPGIVEKWEHLKDTLAASVGKDELSHEEFKIMVGKFKILSASDNIVTLVAQDHGIRMKTEAELNWANESPGPQYI